MSRSSANGGKQRAGLRAEVAKAHEIGGEVARQYCEVALHEPGRDTGGWPAMGSPPDCEPSLAARQRNPGRGVGRCCKCHELTRPVVGPCRLRYHFLHFICKRCIAVSLPGRRRAAFRPSPARSWRCLRTRCERNRDTREDTRNG